MSSNYLGYADQELDRLTRRYQVHAGVDDYETARRRVTVDHPELALEFTRVVEDRVHRETVAQMHRWKTQDYARALTFVLDSDPALKRAYART
jgi:hypothetical protein